ncbi:MAG: 4Fe-4S dicluster domain-containing protein [Planctomycetes bacterium]|nr:4Fe-4S dicluster domain-containing protein [Planctomycetota bacterium]
MSFLFATTTAIAGWPGSAWLLSLQAGPQWVRLAAGVGTAGIVLTFLVFVATFFFGRFFCAVLCPLGTCQDIIDLVPRKRLATVPNRRILRYTIAVAAILLFAGGSAIVLRYLDPFSRYGAMVGAAKNILQHGNGAHFSSGMLWTAAVPLFLLVLLVMWKRRLYCVALCPVGTVIGAIAKFSLWRMRIGKTCAGCGRCGSVCPTGCIESATGSVDTERCVLCLKCSSVCPNGSITYALAGNTPYRQRPGSAAVPDISRRKFLIGGSALVLGAVAIGRGFSHVFRTGAHAAERVRDLIYPPGAIDSERFARHCTGCQVCTVACPAGIITPSPSGFGPVRLDYSHNGCAYDCTRCNAVCPSGALRPLDLVDKQWLKIGEAKIDLPQCRIVKDGIACGMCVRACPKGAIFMVEGPDGFAVPEVATFHCIGCGVCLATCPVAPKAITVTPIEQQPVGF